MPLPSLYPFELPAIYCFVAQDLGGTSPVCDRIGSNTAGFERLAGTPTCSQILIMSISQSIFRGRRARQQRSVHAIEPGSLFLSYTQDRSYGYFM
jgi:hypothetical protein